ncbi:hypothetical protein SAMN05421788_11682 [Filimonas lacunae]|uniref:Uncharacterized protein n=1 Tax=Filimonas lacunae TaxID=477680 RepID=A0A173MGG5_9BACT|nr:hypothetical protein [Filimonas lacunae]BAV06714.1 hypothetical protein FLA_2734 [Filimonas lacunae]SIT34473.1 hypothetical protein SAMN05421788_11682 [Filimonas lacunae]
MILPNDILSVLAKDVTITSSSETLLQFVVNAHIQRLNFNLRDSLSALLRDLDSWDRLTLTATISGEPISYASNQLNNELFFATWESEEDVIDDLDFVEIDLRIDKGKLKGDTVNIYNVAIFERYLQELKIFDFVSVFSSFFSSGNSDLFLINPSFKNHFHTNSIHLISDPDFKKNGNVGKIEHIKLWEKLKSVSHFSINGSNIMLPDDFEVLHKGGLSNLTIDKFSVSCLAFSMAILNDFSVLKDDKLSLKMNGYKTISAEVDLKSLKLENLPSYYNIYRWVTSNGGLQDKIGLSRNLISLNISSNDNYSIDQSVYTSILSGFKVYEKQNVKQYIDLRNKMSDQIFGFNEKAGKVIEAFASGFQKSALAVVSLYATMIISKIISSKTLVDLFSLEATILSISFLLASFLYFFVCRWEVKHQKERLIDTYNKMKTRNEDLLTKEDIQRILNNDSEHKSDLEFIDKKTKVYSRLWIGIILLLLFLTIVLHLMYKNNVEHNLNSIVVNKDSTIDNHLNCIDYKDSNLNIKLDKVSDTLKVKKKARQ